LSTERKALLFAESASAGNAATALGSGGTGGGGRDGVPPGPSVDPRNPFVSYRRLKMETWSMAAPQPSGADAKAQDTLWREAVIEINYRRVMGILKVYATIDRKRLELWRVWLRAKEAEGGGGAAVGRRSNGKGKARGFAGAGGADEDEEGDGSKPETSDVWDLIEARVRLLPPLASIITSADTDWFSPASSSTSSSPPSTTTSPANPSSASSSPFTRSKPPLTVTQATTPPSRSSTTTSRRA